MSGWKRIGAAAGVGAVVAMLAVSAPASAAAPANDDFGDAASSVLPWTTTVDTTGATLEAGELTAGCGVDVGATVWYRFEAEAGQDLQLSLKGSDFPAIANLWHGSSLETLEHVGCLWGDAARMHYDVEGGTYHVQLGGSYGEAGTAQVGVALIVPPANDDRAHATEVTSLPFHDDGVEIIHASLEEDEPVPCGGEADLMKSIWYRYRPDSRLTLTAATNYTSYLAVWEENADGSLNEIGCTFGDGIDARAPAGGSYLVQIATSMRAPVGTLDVTISSLSPPPNDDLLDAIPLLDVGDTVGQSTVGATPEPGEQMSSCRLATKTVWFRWSPLQETTAVAAVASPDMWPAVAVWAAPPGGSDDQPLAEVACGSVNARDGTAAAGFLAQAGQTYWIQVSGKDPQSGEDHGGNITLRLDRGIVSHTGYASFEARSDDDGRVVVQIWRGWSGAKVEADANTGEVSTDIDP